jgi:hypothetical protein
MTERPGRYAIFQMAEVVLPRELFRVIQRLINGLRPRPAPAWELERQDSSS